MKRNVLTNFNQPLLLVTFFVLCRLFLHANESELNKIAIDYFQKILPDNEKSNEKINKNPSATTRLQETRQNILDAIINYPKEIAQQVPPNQPQEAEPFIAPPPSKTILINFTDVSIIEYIRFISRLTNKNFIFDENDLQFKVTIISEEPTTIDNIMTGLLQELRIHDLSVVEEGNNIIIHKNPKVNAISTIVTDQTPSDVFKDKEIVTKVFRLNTLDPEKAAVILRPLTSENAIIEIFKASNILIVTDLASNIVKISELLKGLDSPTGGLVIGQYVVNFSSIESLIPLVQQIIQPIVQDQTAIFVPHEATNSIFIISTPYLVERIIAIIQYLDQQQGTNRILELQTIQYEQAEPPPPPAPSVIQTPSGQWIPSPDETSIFKPEFPPPTETPTTPPQGQWLQDENGSWYFVPGVGGVPDLGPRGQWETDPYGNWIFRSPEIVGRRFLGPPSLPGGLVRKGKFYLHRLLYRKGISVERGLRAVVYALIENEEEFGDIIATIESLQWIEPINALSFYGPVEAIEKVRELIAEIDVPLRQVFLDMLLLQTTIDDSLNYSVNYGTRFGGGDTSGSQGFIEGATPLVGALATTGLTGLGLPQLIVNGVRQLPVRFIPNGTALANTPGFNLGVIGQKIVHCGIEFNSLGALVSAIHSRRDDNIILNPKILTEDNTPAEIFVGINTPYQTQSVANDFGSIVTTNLQYQDVGTTLRITPFIGNGDVVTLDIFEEFSSIGTIPTIQSNATQQTFVGPTTNKNMTATRVHLPDGYFLIISGLMQDEYKHIKLRAPCLGGIPLLGAIFSNKQNTDTKRNTMIFIRPQIIDTEDEIQHLTKHNQDIWDYRHNLQNDWEYEVKEALDLLNVRRTLYPSDCNCNDCDN